jgi:hypothetical protein
MQDLTAKRTLVKSPPELWEELSEVERLAKHLGAFGEIKITKLEPEHKVAWEGEHASGTVSIEPSGWGTKVILTAELEANGDPPEAAEAGAKETAAKEEPAPAAAGTTNEAKVSDGVAVAIEEPDGEPAPDTNAEPEPKVTTGTPEPARRRRRGFWSRLFAGWLVPEERLNRGTSTPAAEPNVEAAAAPPIEVRPEADPEPGAKEPAEEEPAADVDTSADLATVIEPPAAIDSERARLVLEETLDALGSAHHRPYSRG